MMRSASAARPPDAIAAERVVKIGPGEHHVTDRPGEVIATTLGSCIAACIRDPVAGVGGMNHFMLPASKTGAWGGVSGSLRYGNFAMERLINDILSRGGRRERLEAKLFGGGEVLRGDGHGSGPGSSASVGLRNAEFAEAYLAAETIWLAAKHLRGNCARRLRYNPRSGQALMLELPMTKEATVASQERRYRDELARARPADDIELF